MVWTFRVERAGRLRARRPLYLFAITYYNATLLVPAAFVRLQRERMPANVTATCCERYRPVSPSAGRRTLRLPRLPFITLRAVDSAIVVFIR